MITLDPSSRGSVAYRKLAAEVEARYGLEVHVPPPPPPKEEPIELDEKATVIAGTPGPRGRGYGTVSPEPEGLDEAFPRPEFWTVYR